MIYNFTNLFTAFVESFLSLMICKSFLKSRENMPKYIHYFAVIVLAIMIVVSNTLFQYGVLNGVVIILSIFAVSYIFSGNFFTRLLLAAFAVLLNGMAEMIVLFLLAFFMDVSTANVVSTPSTRLLGAILSKIVGCIIVKLICMRTDKDLKRTPMYWTMFFLIFSTSVLTIFVFFNLSYHSTTNDKYYLAIVCSIGLLVSSIFVVNLYERMLKQAEVIGKQKTLEELTKAQTKHMEEIVINQNNLKKFRHDVSNHFIALSTYFSENDMEGGLEYLERIKARSDAVRPTINTGNIALDAILSSKKELAESKGIKFITKLQIPENLAIKPDDISIIFGNALDNAIEANEMVPENDRYIEVSLLYDNLLICKISNACMPLGNKEFKTRKLDKENHGFGMENIKSVINGYNGEVKIEWHDYKFVLYISIPI